MSHSSHQNRGTSAPSVGSGGQVELRFTSDPANLAPVREAVERLALAGGLDATDTGEVGLCVNEALANVMRHAYGGAVDKPIEVRARWQNRSLVITVRDWGNGIDPSGIQESAKKHNPLKPGGLGLICLRKLMDDTTFAPQRDGMLLTMVKNADADKQAL
jgi:anti-sigma regulatory factor (Ser/Thr protein kinase)